MEQLIFLAVILFFTFIDAMARKQKERQKGRQAPTPEWESEEELPGYDRDPTYDDRAGAGARTVPSGRDEAEGRGSEAMIPEDIWAEIREVARGSRSQPEARTGSARRRSEPEPMREYQPPPVAEPEAPPEPQPLFIPKDRPERAPVEVHRVHRSHADYGTDPSSRAPAIEDVVNVHPMRANASIRSVRRRLSGQGRTALREAMILHEVLGPPAALRGERFSDPE